METTPPKQEEESKDEGEESSEPQVATKAHGAANVLEAETPTG